MTPRPLLALMTAATVLVLSAPGTAVASGTDDLLAATDPVASTDPLAATDPIATTDPLRGVPAGGDRWAPRTESSTDHGDPNDRWAPRVPPSSQRWARQDRSTTDRWAPVEGPGTGTSGDDLPTVVPDAYPASPAPVVPTPAPTAAPDVPGTPAPVPSAVPSVPSATPSAPSVPAPVPSAPSVPAPVPSAVPSAPSAIPSAPGRPTSTGHPSPAPTSSPTSGLAPTSAVPAAFRASLAAVGPRVEAGERPTSPDDLPPLGPDVRCYSTSRCYFLNPEGLTNAQIAQRLREDPLNSTSPAPEMRPWALVVLSDDEKVLGASSQPSWGGHRVTDPYGILNHRVVFAYCRASTGGRPVTASTPAHQVWYLIEPITSPAPAATWMNGEYLQPYQHDGRLPAC